MNKPTNGRNSRPPKKRITRTKLTPQEQDLVLTDRITKASERRVHKVELPDGTTPEEVMSIVRQYAEGVRQQKQIVSLVSERLKAASENMVKEVCNDLTIAIAKPDITPASKYEFPKIDILDYKDRVVIIAAVPGYKKEELHVTIEEPKVDTYIDEHNNMYNVRNQLEDYVLPQPKEQKVLNRFYDPYGINSVLNRQFQYETPTKRVLIITGTASLSSTLVQPKGISLDSPNIIRKELKASSFKRVISLATWTETFEDATSTLADGLLTITLRKKKPEPDTSVVEVPIEPSSAYSRWATLGMSATGVKSYALSSLPVSQIQLDGTQMVHYQMPTIQAAAAYEVSHQKKTEEKP